MDEALLGSIDLEVTGISGRLNTYAVLANIIWIYAENKVLINYACKAIKSSFLSLQLHVLYKTSYESRST